MKKIIVDLANPNTLAQVNGCLTLLLGSNAKLNLIIPIGQIFKKKFN